MPKNDNPFKPKDTRIPLIKTVAASGAAAIVLVIVSFVFNLNGFLGLGIVLLGAFFAAAMVWRSN